MYYASSNKYNIETATYQAGVLFYSAWSKLHWYRVATFSDESSAKTELNRLLTTIDREIKELL